MYGVIRYGILFAVLLLLQVLMLNNLDISIYLCPQACVAFVILLPMDLAPVWVLGAGLLMGVAGDWLAGMPATNTIAMLLVAFVRSGLLNLLVGKELVHDGGVPGVERIGVGKFYRYVTVMVVLQCALFFTLEAMSLSHYGLTLLRIAVSAAATVVLVRVAEMLFVRAS